MSRKPADKLRPNESRQAIWDRIRQLRDVTFTSSQIELLVDLERTSIRDYLVGLCKAGFLEATPGAGIAKPVQYRLVKDNGQEAPRVRKDGSLVTQGLAREQMWRAMWIFAQKGRTFTFRDLTLFASIDSSPVAESDAKQYCQSLHKAGYLVQAQQGGPAKPALYRMPIRKWTGPQPVQIQRTRRCYDPNTGDTMHLEVVNVEGGE